MALKDWKQINANEFTNKKKNALIIVDSVRDKTIVNIMNLKTLKLKSQKIFNNRPSAIKYVNKLVSK